MSDLNLLPCPICGREADIAVTPKGDFRITCTDCCCVQGPVRDKLITAGATWNKLCTGSRLRHHGDRRKPRLLNPQNL